MSDDTDTSTLRVGKFTTIAPSADSGRISLLLWGASGCGKTTLAATAPGRKLWLLFDPDGDRSLVGRSDIAVLDLSGERHTVTSSFKDDNPFGLEGILKQHPDIRTVVLDSVTAFGILATESAIANVSSATNENPGLKGYGYRNAVVLRACISLMRLTKRLNLNIIIIAHEDTPTTNASGDVLMITVALGGKMTNSLGMQLSEIWWMNDTGKERRIAVRNVRLRQPMKTRMFEAGAGEFVWKFDASKWEGDGIAAWFDQWQTNDGRKIALPK